MSRKKDDSAVIFQKIQITALMRHFHVLRQIELKASRLLLPLRNIQHQGAGFPVHTASLINFFQDQHDIIGTDKIITALFFRF